MQTIERPTASQRSLELHVSWSITYVLRNTLVHGQLENLHVYDTLWRQDTQPFKLYKKSSRNYVLMLSGD